MANNNKIKAAFQLEPVRLPLDCLLEQRPLSNAKVRYRSYNAILTSLREVGLVQPLIVCPIKGEVAKYKILDGHLRLYALRELEQADALCVISTDDERYTFDAQVNHINPIQRHKMIRQAVENGVKPERIAAALDIDVKKVLNEVKLLDGIHPDAVELLKDKPIYSKAIKVMRRVNPLRQLEMAESMCAVNNFTEAYALALLAGTRSEQMLNGRKPKELNGVSAESLARMEQEMESLRVDFEQLEQSYSDNVYSLVVIQGYVKRLLANEEIKRFLERNHPDMLPELTQIAEMDSLAV